MKRGILCTAIIAMMMIAMLGCQVDTETGEISTVRPEDIPSIILENATLTMIQSESRIIEISASRVETYPEKEYQLFEDIVFFETDLEGKILSNGNARTAQYNFDSDNIVLEGDIEFYSVEYETLVRTDYAVWDNESRLLFGRDSDMVEIIRDSGSRAQGRGFFADMEHQTFEIRETVEGVLVTEPASGESTPTASPSVLDDDSDLTRTDGEAEEGSGIEIDILK